MIVMPPSKRVATQILPPDSTANESNLLTPPLKFKSIPPLVDKGKANLFTTPSPIILKL